MQQKVLVPRQSPHKLLFLLTSTLLGAVYITGTPAPTSIAATQPAWEIHVWAVGMFLSGVAGFAGCFWRTDLRRALRLEASGMYLGAATMMIYAVSLFGYAGWRALASGLTFALWAAANLWRQWQIGRDLKALQ